MYIYIYTYTCTHKQCYIYHIPSQVVAVCSGRSGVEPNTYIHIDMRVCVHVYLHIHIHMCTHTMLYLPYPLTGGGCLQREIGGWAEQIHSYIYMRVCVHVYVRIHVCIQCFIIPCRPQQVVAVCSGNSEVGPNTYIHIDMRVCVCLYMYTYTHTHVHTYNVILYQISPHRWRLSAAGDRRLGRTHTYI